MTAGRFQFVWWGWRYACKPPMFAFLGEWPEGPRDDGYAGCVYEWRLVLGPLEIRRWA